MDKEEDAPLERVGRCCQTIKCPIDAVHGGALLIVRTGHSQRSFPPSLESHGAGRLSEKIRYEIGEDYEMDAI